ncbi:MAG: hypothetical protein OEU26_35395, partial [Candidatus Tectomicrobia bacterium]|nr:hypothetical protein [Candidatus Tectomicrobia bacterium]
MHLILFVTYTKRMFRAHRIISRCRQIEVWAVALASALAFTFWGLRFTLAEENGSLRPDVAKWVA